MMMTTLGHTKFRTQTIIGERACFLVRNEYSGGHAYWHGFSSKKSAQEFAATFQTLTTQTTIHFGVATMTEKNLDEVDRVNGCVLDDDQVSNLRRIQ
jgi:hypothetical protein